MTINGERQPQDFQNYDYILPHEHLVQNLTRYFTGSKNSIDQIELFNYAKVKEEPYSNMSNLALNDIEEISTELKLAFGEHKTLIIEPTNTESGRDLEKLKIISTRNRIDIISGYKPIIKGTLYTDEEKNKVFINTDKFGKEIQEALFGEKEPIHSGFLGELFLEDDLFDKHQNVIFESCIRQAVQYSIPIYIECRRTKNLELLNRTLDFINQIAAGAPLKIVLWNLDLLFRKEIARSQDSVYPYVKTTFENIETIKELIKRGLIVGFDVYDYIDEIYELATLVKILIDDCLQDSLLISSGVKFKTHLKKYGGIGYGVIEKFVGLLKELQVTEGQIEHILKNNVLQLMHWWKPLKVKEVYVKRWQCEVCGKEQDESVGKFSKEGHDFCTPKCMRAFKYD